MKTFIQSGDVMTVTAPTGGVTSGDGVIVGSLFGVAAFTAAEDEAVEIATRGVYALPKEPTAVIAAGDQVAWDAGTKKSICPAPGSIPLASPPRPPATASPRCVCGWTGSPPQRRRSREPFGPQGHRAV